MDIRIAVFTQIAVVTLCFAQNESKTVNTTAGQSVTLNPDVGPLGPEDQILWSYGSEKHRLANYDAGKLAFIKSSRYQVDDKTGSLTILSVSAEDGGLYTAQIVNGKGSFHHFNLIVEEAGSSPDAAADHKINMLLLTVAVVLVLFA